MNLNLFVLTDGVSGVSGICGRGEGPKAKSVLCSDSEQVVLSLQQAWHDIGLAGTGSIHLCPGFVSDTFFLNEITLDSLSTIAVREFPD